MAPVGVETTLAEIEGLTALWKQTLGDPEICIAVLDGPVDDTHPCFRGAKLTRLQTLVAGDAAGWVMQAHGTHVTSEIFGQPGGPIHGVAPHCRGLIVPVFRDGHRLTQLDLARAIEQAVHAGAHVINISGGERSPEGEADDLLAPARSGFARIAEYSSPQPPEMTDASVCMSLPPWGQFWPLAL